MATKCGASESALSPAASPCNGVSVTGIVFNASSRTLVSGTDNTVGVVYRYSNAGTAPDGTVLDALVTVQSYSNNQDSNLTNFSSADVPGATAGFEQNLQPNINQESGTFLSSTYWQGSITYRIQFVVTGTNTPKIISVAATSIDNDGGSVCSSTLRESVTYSTALNQVLTSTTTTQTVSGNTITGPTTNQANIGTGMDYANAALYINVSEINWTYSFTTPTTAVCTAGGASAARYGSLNMNCQITFDRTFAAVGLSGTVFNDTNGLSDSTVSGTGTGTPGGTQLYANLLDSNNNVVASVPVAANGTYTFSAVAAGNYSVQISTNQGVESSAAPATALPSGWVNTGENLGAGAGNDGTVNGLLPVTVGSSTITNANFGIEQRPTANNNTAASQDNPGGTTSVAVPATTFSATDPAGGTISSIKITAFPSNATSIRINGTTYTSATFPAGGVTVPTNASGNPTQTISVDPIDGAVTVVIPYAAIDNAGVQSASTATASVPFTLAPSAASAVISGRLIFDGAPLRNTLVTLLDANTNRKKIARTDANGDYLFEEEVGKAYILQPLSSKYSFNPSTKVVNLLEDAVGVDFVSTAKNYRPKNDFDGDGRSDLAVFRPSEGNWYVLKSSDNQMSVFQFGASGDIPVSGDFDGDGKNDFAVFRPSEANWYIWQSNNQTMHVENFGVAGDKLVASDYDGDGRTDIAVFRQGIWFIKQSSDDSFAAKRFGQENDLPTAQDFDGDGRTDLAIYRRSDRTWYINQSQGNIFSAQRFGLEMDTPLAADFDGDGFADIAQFRSGNWFIQNSAVGFEAVENGVAGDKIITGDYDGDGRADAAVYREGVWQIKNSSSGAVRIENFGLPTDVVIE